MAIPTLLYSDLDERPYLLDKTLALFQAAGPGRNHAVAGEPWRMGLAPRSSDLDNALGVFIAILDGHPVAAIAVCPYSEDQVTLWGPVFNGSFNETYANGLLEKIKQNLRSVSFTSYRILVDTRNRQLREFVLNHGLKKFQDNIIYQRTLDKPTDISRFPVDTAKSDELSKVEEMLLTAFPENGHCSPGLDQRAEVGYTHYVLRAENTICGCAVVSRHTQRSWLSMVCIDNSFRGKGYSHDLLNGVINNEYGQDAKEIALEVLADNKAANALYLKCGFDKSWTASIYTGPL